MGTVHFVDFRAPRRRRVSLPPPPDVLALFVAAADTAARVGWAAWVGTARLWLVAPWSVLGAAWAVLDAAERGMRR